MQPVGLDPLTQKGIDATLNLTVYGPLGILALIAIIVAAKFYLDNRRDRKEFAVQLAKERAECETERKQHAEQMRQLEERYIAKADTNLEKYHTLAESMNRVLESTARRYPRSGGQGRNEDTRG
jgi:hypothetical protein